MLQYCCNALAQKRLPRRHTAQGKVYQSLAVRDAATLWRS